MWLQPRLATRRLSFERETCAIQERSNPPLAKAEAREFLQQSIPCMAFVVRRYQQVMSPLAQRLADEARLEHQNAVHKRSEFAVHPTLKHETHTAWTDRAVSVWHGSVPRPRDLLADLRRSSQTVAAHVQEAQLMPGPNLTLNGAVLTDMPGRYDLGGSGRDCNISETTKTIRAEPPLPLPLPQHGATMSPLSWLPDA